MKTQATTLIMNKPERKLFLLAGLMLIAISNTGLMAGAQSLNQDSYLPPEVIPVNSAIKYTANTSTAPGIVSTIQPAVAPPVVQSAQEARQALFNSLMGTNVYPQFNGQNFSANQAFNQEGNTNNIVGNQNFNQSQPQTLSNNNSFGQSNLITPNSNLYGSVSNSQTQTLSGSANTPPTSQPRTSGGIGRLGGLLAGVGLSGLSMANGNGAGNIYSSGLMGASMLNFGVRNGFNF